MASPPASLSSDLEKFSSILSDIAKALEEGDIFICARPKRTNQRILGSSKTSYKGSEQGSAKDGKQDISPSRDGERSTHSHERISQKNTSAVAPPCTSVFILDSSATSHVVGHVSLFSPSSFRFRTAPTTPDASPAGAATDTYQADDGSVLTVSGVGTVSCDNFRIPNVRCVPDLCTTGLNLVSVQQLAECGYLVAFGGSQCSVMEKSSGKVVGKGLLHADDGLYHLEFLNILHDDKGCDDNTAT